MDISSVQKLCIDLISSAVQRCRLSEDLCRLSVVLKSSPPIIRVSISDTGTGSCLEEFQDLKCNREGIGTEKWDGLLSIKTTSISDNKIYHYHLNLRGSVSARRLTRLPSILKNDAKFSGTEVCLSISETIDALLNDIKHYFQKMLILKIPSVAAELVIERGDASGLRCQNVFLPNECSPLNFSSSNVERLKSGLEEYVLKHRNSLNNKCDSCFCSREKLKISSGVARSMESHRSPGLIVEAVIAISEHSESLCFRSSGNKTEVLHFKDFSPSSVSIASLNALTSIDWRSYGLTLVSAVDQVDHALIEWESLPPYLHIDMVIHCYHKQVITFPGKCKYQPDRHLIKKGVKLALDDLKEKHTGLLLSAHAVKICSYAPDLASSIAGIILSSNDVKFRSKCSLLLELSQSQEIGKQTVEDRIKEKIISVIETNDRKPEKIKEAAPFLFEDDRPQDLDPADLYLEEHEGGDDVFSFPD
ncbi:type 2 DNA topoisomerase 6 subunit B-like isoform X1 [Gossypium hirsutum]|uniref:Type 2 DNA topoisomerase 6 subunit B-like isoform X1 n=1 Tax=Gossypium hirsutum TaxID=3635 RepID=A0ABM3BW53_GOSHI|nr:type 2 DNA topoisomerase 6 subunit B-like isoform X1 [Gossypium hirsutum]